MYLNRGELHFALDSKCLREYATGTIASQTISLPTDWLENFVLIVNNKKVDHLEVALQDYERYINSGDQHWYMWEVAGVRTIKFLSTTADGLTYKLWYFKKPTTALAETTDTSVIPIEYREASVYWAAWQMMQQIGKADLANSYMSVYASLVNSAMTDTKNQYMSRVNPNVDIGVDPQPTVDVQGRGFLY
jgi:hypothetical protein